MTTARTTPEMIVPWMVFNGFMWDLPLAGLDEILAFLVALWRGPLPRPKD
jgi:hypothetical protein